MTDLKEHLKQLSREELVAFRDLLQTMVPDDSLLDINLEHELLALMRHGQKLLETVIVDTGIPANQKSQCLNSLASTLDQLAKRQAEVYDSERIKRCEQVFVKTLKGLSTQYGDAVVEEALRIYSQQWGLQFRGNK